MVPTNTGPSKAACLQLPPPSTRISKRSKNKAEVYRAPPTPLRVSSLPENICLVCLGPNHLASACRATVMTDGRPVYSAWDPQFGCLFVKGSGASICARWNSGVCVASHRPTPDAHLCSLCGATAHPARSLACVAPAALSTIEGWQTLVTTPTATRRPPSPYTTVLAATYSPVLPPEVQNALDRVQKASLASSTTSPHAKLDPPSDRSSMETCVPAYAEIDELRERLAFAEARADAAEARANEAAARAAFAESALLVVESMAPDLLAAMQILAKGVSDCL
jgi:hypothetical protein